MNTTELRGEAARQRQRGDEHEDAYSHKDVTSNPYYREARRLDAIADMMDAGVTVTTGGSGTVYVNDKYEYALLTGKWRQRGNTKWYRSAGPEDFVQRFIKRNA